MDGGSLYDPGAASGRTNNAVSSKVSIAYAPGTIFAI